MCVVERKKNRDVEGKVVDWCVDGRKCERGGKFVEDERERESGGTIKLQILSNLKL